MICTGPRAPDLRLPAAAHVVYDSPMRIAKPILLVSTPVGVVGGLVEAYRMAGGLVFIMFAMVCVISAAIGSVVSMARREQAALRSHRKTHTVVEVS